MPEMTRVLCEKFLAEYQSLCKRTGLLLKVDLDTLILEPTNASCIKPSINEIRNHSFPETEENTE